MSFEPPLFQTINFYHSYLVHLLLLSSLDNISLEGEMPGAVVLHDETWHAGVVGIVASRIKDRVHRPVIAFAASHAFSEYLMDTAW